MKGNNTLIYVFFKHASNQDSLTKSNHFYSQYGIIKNRQVKWKHERDEKHVSFFTWSCSCSAQSMELTREKCVHGSAPLKTTDLRHHSERETLMYIMYICHTIYQYKHYTHIINNTTCITVVVENTKWTYF